LQIETSEWTRQVSRVSQDHEAEDEMEPRMNVRLMRGQCVVREAGEARSSVLWTPDESQREVQTHRGVVLGLGPPAEMDGVPQPWGVEVGDVVQYHYIHNRAAHTRPWPPDGLRATWVPQSCVDAVIEGEEAARVTCSVGL